MGVQAGSEPVEFMSFACVPDRRGQRVGDALLELGDPLLNRGDVAAGAGEVGAAGPAVVGVGGHLGVVVGPPDLAGGGVGVGGFEPAISSSRRRTGRSCCPSSGTVSCPLARWGALVQARATLLTSWSVSAC